MRDDIQLLVFYISESLLGNDVRGIYLLFYHGLLYSLAVCITITFLKTSAAMEVFLQQ